MFSRVRWASVAIIVAIGVVGAVFYALVNSHFLGEIIGRTLGPYSDTLAEYVLDNRDPDLWGRIAAHHDVGILVEPIDGEPIAFDRTGVKVAPEEIPQGQIRAERTAEDGTRITLYWTLWSFQEGHLPLMAGLLVMAVLAVVPAVWFLQRQLKPLAMLYRGVESVAAGEFATRVPVVRRDEIGQVAEAFNVMAGRVGEMIDDRERLLADVSHELRSPIARMKVALEFIPEGEKRDALVRDLREMENLIAALLEREGLRSRTGRPEFETVDIQRIARDVVSVFADRGPGVEWIRGRTVETQADPDLIRLLIQNLIDNAVKFSPSGSRPVGVQVGTEDDRVVLRVKDDGVGLPSGAETRVFEPFVKLDPARGHGVGYGIGLNLCQRIVQIHGGEIRLLPREPRGTEAIVTLPV